MLEGKELWTGCLALDEAQGVLHLGRQTVLVAGHYFKVRS